MTNIDIATLMSLAENTAHHHKTNALKKLKELKEANGGEKILTISVNKGHINIYQLMKR